VFSLEEMVAAFDISAVNPTRRFDLKKAESINGDHIRLLAPEDFLDRALPYLQTAGLLAAHPRTPTPSYCARFFPTFKSAWGYSAKCPTWWHFSSQPMMAS